MRRPRRSPAARLRRGRAFPQRRARRPAPASRRRPSRARGRADPGRRGSDPVDSDRAAHRHSADCRTGPSRHLTRSSRKTRLRLWTNDSPATVRLHPGLTLARHALHSLIVRRFSGRKRMSGKKNDSGDRTEKPTAKRLKDARKEGDVHKSKELTSTVLVLIWLVMVWLLTPVYYRRLE